MAIDTQEKRLSLLSFGRPGFTLPVADGSLDTGDRQHFLGLYSGIDAGSGITPRQIAGIFRIPGGVEGSFRIPSGIAGLFRVPGSIQGTFGANLG